jgi:hypothetical protein
MNNILGWQPGATLFVHLRPVTWRTRNFVKGFRSLRRGQCPPVIINQAVIPQVETVKYLGIHFDKRLTWKNHVSTKRKQLDHKTREIKWLIGRHSPPIT